jgi:hypothetical protein
VGTFVVGVLCVSAHHLPIPNCTTPKKKMPGDQEDGSLAARAFVARVDR